MQKAIHRAGPQALRLVPIDPVGASEKASTPQSRSQSFLVKHKGVLALVALPTLLAAIYWLLMAAPRYEAESKFVVRSPSNAATSQLANLVQGTGIIRSSDDAYIVHAYMRSRDASRMLVRDAQLLERLNRSEVDFLWRYPTFWSSANEEKLWKHVQSLIAVDYDSTTGISTLRVQAFRAEDARVLADTLLTASEALINRLSERAQGDAIQAAEKEVEISRTRAFEAQNAVTQFRSREGMVDPTRVSTTSLEVIARLALEAAQTKAQLAETERASPQNPQIPTLRTRIAALDNQIEQERRQLAGSDLSLAPRIATYERLMLEREFAERTFLSALTSLEVARVDAQRQRLFLERVSNPQPPDYAKYPYRLLSILAVFLVALALYSILRRLIADTLTHAGI